MVQRQQNAQIVWAVLHTRRDTKLSTHQFQKQTHGNTSRSWRDWWTEKVGLSTPHGSRHGDNVKHCMGLCRLLHQTTHSSAPYVRAKGTKEPNHARRLRSQPEDATSDSNEQRLITMNHAKKCTRWKAEPRRGCFHKGPLPFQLKGCSSALRVPHDKI